MLNISIIKKVVTATLIVSAISMADIVLFTFVSGSTQTSAFAQEGSKAAEQKTRKTPAMTERVYKRLGEAQELMDQEKYAEAFRVLNTLKADPKLNSYEKAMTLNFLAFGYSTQEKFSQAINVYKQVLKQPEIPVALEQQTIYTMAQLYLVLEKFDLAISSLKRWLSISPKPSTSAYVLLGQASFQKEDYKNAAKYIEQAMALAKSQGNDPQEQWLLILRATYYELKKNEKITDILKLLVKLYPKGEYFYQLSGRYAEKDDEPRQLAIIEAGYDGGYLTKGYELITLASLLLSNDVPYKAAKVLDIGMKDKIVEADVDNLKLLAQAWLVAQEPRKSIDVLKRAAKKSDDGELYVRLGQSYADLDEWAGCISSIRSGVKKGKIDYIGRAYISLGFCLFNTDDLDGAIGAFRSAKKDDRSKKHASSWLKYLQGEKARRLKIKNSLI